MRILLTAFEAFGGEAINPTEQALAKIELGETGELSKVQLDKVVLPTEFYKAGAAVAKLLSTNCYDAAIFTGQAGGREGITPERVAINLDDAGIPDNLGDKPEDLPIKQDGANAYFSTLPVKKIVKALQEQGLKSYISNSAGTYVCNHVLYMGLYTIAKNNLPTIAGFMHVPYVPEQTINKAKAPSMSLSDITKGLKTALEVTIADICERRDR